MRLTTALIFTALALSAQHSKFSGPSDANPPVSENDLRIVQRARELLNSPAKWNRADNRECPAAQQTYSLYCALEKATEEVSHQFEHRGAVMQQARFAIDEVLAKGNHYEHRLRAYNNDEKAARFSISVIFGSPLLSRFPHGKDSRRIVTLAS